MKTKTLNPELFGELASTKRASEANRLLDSMKFQAPMGELNFEEDVQSAIKDMQNFKQELQNIKDSFNESQSNTKLKMERMQIAVTKLEQAQGAFVHEISEKMQNIFTKFSEQRKHDQKIQELIDRHNNLLKGYEIRMNQTQKILAQKESELVEVHAMLNDAKMELARMKRL